MALQTICNFKNNIKETVGDMKKGMHLYCFSDGQFSLIAILGYILNKIGKSNIWIASWTIGLDSIQALKIFRDRCQIGDIKILIDRSYDSRNKIYSIKLKQAIGENNIYTISNHAKMVIICNETWNISIITSMNMNKNKRLEFVEIIESKAMAEFIIQTFKDIVKWQAENRNRHRKRSSKVTQGADLSMKMNPNPLKVCPIYPIG